MFGGYEDDPRVIQPESLPPEFQVADLGLDGKCEPDLSPFAIVRFQGWTERPDLDAVCVDRYARQYMK